MAIAITLNLRNYDPPGLVAYARNHNTALAAEPFFSTPSPTVAAFQTKFEALETKIGLIAQTQDQLHGMMLDRDTLVAELGELFNQRAFYIGRVPNVTPALVSKVGLSPRGVPAPVGGMMPQLTSLSATMSDRPGSIDLHFDPPPDSAPTPRAFYVQMCLDPMDETKWAQVATWFKSSGTVPGLTSGSRYWFCVAAVGSDGVPGPWSDPAMKMAP